MVKKYKKWFDKRVRQLYSSLEYTYLVSLSIAEDELWEKLVSEDKLPFDKADKILMEVKNNE